MRPGSKMWTPGEVEKLRKMVRINRSLDEMMKVLGRSKNSIQRKIYDEGMRHVVPVQGAGALAYAPPRVPPRSTESLTAFVLGDPAPGRSALDQRAGR